MARVEAPRGSTAACPEGMLPLCAASDRFDTGDAARPGTRGRTPLGRLALHRSVAPTAPRLLRQDSGATGCPGPPGPADGQLRLAPGQRGLARARGRCNCRGPQGRPHDVRPRGDLRGDQPDRGLLRDHVAVLPRPPLRAAEVHRRPVHGEGLHLLRAALRHRGVHEQRDRRDQVADGLHGRVPADDEEGHLHHQRHGARRRVAARAFAGRLLRAHAGQDQRQGRLRRQDHPQPRCLARVRGRQEGPRRRSRGSQAQAAGDHLPQGPGLDLRGDP